MSAAVLQIFQSFLTRFLKAHRPLIEEYRRTDNTRLRIERKLNENTEQLTEAKEKEQTLRSRDERALPLSLWVHGSILAVLAGSESIVNYLAGEGLFLSQRLTLGVTAAMTLCATLLVALIAHEERSILRRTADGDVVHSMTKRVMYLFAGLGFLVGTLYLRVKYFQASSTLERQLLGNLHISAWLVGITLTILSGMFIGIAAYLLTHADRDLAACKRLIAKTASAIRKLEKAHITASAHGDRVTDNLNREIEIAHSELIGQLATANLLPVTADEQNALLDELRERLWKAASTMRSERRDDEGEAGSSPLAALVPQPKSGSGGERLSPIPTPTPQSEAAA